MFFIITWLLIVFVISIMPVSNPETSFPLDKIEHFLLYGTTMVIFFRHFKKRYNGTKAFTISFITSSAYGILMELVQAITPYRDFSYGDIAANTVGAFILGLLCLALPQTKQDAYRERKQ